MNTSPAHLLTDDFLKAVKDYRWLLEKGYPHHLLLKNFHPHFSDLRPLIA